MSAARKKVDDIVPEHLRELSEKLPLTLTLQETAECMKMHPRTVQRMIASGELRATRARLRGGSRIVVTRSEVVRWFSARDARG